MPRQEEDLAQTRGFPASRAGRFQEEGENTPPSSWPQAPTPPGHCPPQGPPYCHTGPATWPVISGQGEGEVKPDWGGGGGLVWQIPRLVFWGWPHPAGPSSSSAQPHPYPLTRTSPSPRTGQALATPRLHPMGEQERGSSAH